MGNDGTMGPVLKKLNTYAASWSADGGVWWDPRGVGQIGSDWSTNFLPSDVQDKLLGSTH
jgi:hypothetical protein